MNTRAETPQQRCLSSGLTRPPATRSGSQQPNRRRGDSAAVGCLLPRSVALNQRSPRATTPAPGEAAHDGPDAQRRPRIVTHPVPVPVRLPVHVTLSLPVRRDTETVKFKGTCRGTDTGKGRTTAQRTTHVATQSPPYPYPYAYPCTSPYPYGEHRRSSQEPVPVVARVPGPAQSRATLTSCPASTSVFSRFARSISASTIIAASCWTLVPGFHPSFSFAFVASPRSSSTSVGR